MAGSGSGGSGSGSGGGGGGSTSTACAACKYQRRKCTPDCPLAPYFPPDQPKRFQNVHKLFGVSNILRILKHVDPSKREDTVKSIAYEADTREKDPVHGCLGVITILQNQVSKLKDELAIAREQLYIVQQQHHHHHTFNQQAQAQAQMHEIVGSTLGGSTALVNVSSSAQQQQQQQQESNVLMQHLQQQYNDMTQLSSEFAKSNPLPISSFEPDEYLRNVDSFDPIKPGSASTSRFDIGRYIRGESPVSHHQHQQSSASSLLAGVPVKEEEDQADVHHHRGATTSTMQYAGMGGDSGTTTAAATTTFQSHSSSDHNVLQDLDHHAFDTPDPYAMALRRRPGPGNSSGFLNLTVASDSELRRASSHHGSSVVPEHELRSAGVYLTLTNN